MQFSSYGNWVKPIPHVLARFGVDGHALLSSLGLANHKEGERLPAEKTAEAWRLAAQLSGQPSIGIHAAKAIHPASWGALGHAVLSCENLHHAISLLLKYPAFISDSIRIEAYEGTETFTLETFPVSKQLPGVESLEFGMATGFQLLNAIFPAQLKLKSLSLTRTENCDATSYQEFYQCEDVFFGQASAKQVFYRKDIYLPLPFANAELTEHHEKLVQQQLQKQGFDFEKNTFIEQVTARLRQQLNAGHINQTKIAEELNISSRHMQRKLKALNTSFSDLVDSIRKESALALLKSRQKSLTDIAHQLGFSDHSNFTRAFKRWHGLTPTQFLELAIQQSAANR
ncbi:AraC family transcriptional regulator ligand-binding domain-containing protein [Simiduia curdlanivorans]|uniref:AraC family transcriptional regulator ligand-binding domain-containing protein n=1 Tax=Simiduia curdlanivorans TaxID=1492769 RepID=A0ABV8V903_9GAMM|nr:AraC family transcriptional regulator [Simiduia curdlanivorans]MDN3638608.1 AraC family transcriptional regulator ligand-binding domain-containing protein [Simiduia curdlanivorans]